MARPHTPLMLLGLVAVLVMLPGIDAPLIFDDQATITDNASLRSLSTALHPPNNTPVAGRPLVNLTFAVNHRLHGDHVVGYHVVNLLLHAANALLVAAGLRKMSDVGWRMSDVKDHLGPLALVHPTSHIRHPTSDIPHPAWLLPALLWAVHPLHSETVTYLTQRTELLVAFFMLGCVVAWLHERRLLAVACSAGAMACKEVAFALPLLIVILDALLRRPLRWRWYAALAGTWGVLAVLHIGGPRNLSASTQLGMTPWDYLRMQAQIIPTYLRMIVWPDGLSIAHARPSIERVNDWLPGGLFILTLLMVTLVLTVKRHVAALAGWWFFLILAPSSSWVPVTTQVMAERRMYLPLLAGVVLLTSVTRLRPVLVLGVGALLVVTPARVAQFRSEVGIWASATRASPASDQAWDGYGAALGNAGRWEASLAALERAVQINPGNHYARSNLGVTLSRLGREPEALEQFELTVALRPEHYLGWENLGKSAYRAGEDAKAIEALTRALAVGPPLAQTHYVIALAAERSGRLDLAVNHLAMAAELDPTHFHARFRLGTLLGRMGRLDEAIPWLEAAVRLDPSNEDAAFNLALARRLQLQSP